MRILSICSHVYLKYFYPILIALIIFGLKIHTYLAVMSFCIATACVLFAFSAKCSSCGRKIFYYDYGDQSVFFSINVLKFPPSRCSKCDNPI